MKLATKTICDVLNLASEVRYRVAKLTEDARMAPVKESVMESLGSGATEDDDVRVESGRVVLSPKDVPISQVQEWLERNALIPAMPRDQFIDRACALRSAAKYREGVATILAETLEEKVTAKNLVEVLATKLGDAADRVIVSSATSPRISANSINKAKKEFAKPRRGSGKKP